MSRQLGPLPVQRPAREPPPQEGTAATGPNTRGSTSFPTVTQPPDAQVGARCWRPSGSRLGECDSAGQPGPEGSAGGAPQVRSATASPEGSKCQAILGKAPTVLPDRPCFQRPARSRARHLGALGKSGLPQKLLPAYPWPRKAAQGTQRTVGPRLCWAQKPEGTGMYQDHPLLPVSVSSGPQGTQALLSRASPRPLRSPASQPRWAACCSSSTVSLASSSLCPRSFLRLLH